MHTKASMPLTAFLPFATLTLHLQMILCTLRGPPEPETHPEATESSYDSEAASSDIEIVEPEAGRRLYAWLYVGSHNSTLSAWGR
jgi:hypothetical protein